MIRRVHAHSRALFRCARRRAASCAPPPPPPPPPPDAPSQNPLRAALRSYDELLKQRPLSTTSAVGAALGVGGDALTQQITSAPYDLPRALSFGLFGAFLTGPVNYVWLPRLDSLVTSLAPAGGLRAVAIKVGFQGLFFQPAVYLPLFFGFSAATRGWSYDATAERVRSDYGRTLVSLWSFWTPICIYVFSSLPVRQQSTVFSLVSFTWNALLSFLSNGSETSTALERNLSGAVEAAQMSGALVTRPTA